MSAVHVAPSLFKAYDIRGVVDTALTPDAVRLIGAALGSEAAALGKSAICVGRDGRLSGPLLRDALVAGITSTGTDVIDVGMVPTPVLYFSTVHLGTGSGVEITGSHNPPEYNGLKMMMAGDDAAWRSDPGVARAHRERQSGPREDAGRKSAWPTCCRRISSAYAPQ